MATPQKLCELSSPLCLIIFRRREREIAGLITSRRCQTLKIWVQGEFWKSVVSFTAKLFYKILRTRHWGGETLQSTACLDLAKRFSSLDYFLKQTLKNITVNKIKV